VDRRMPGCAAQLRARLNNLHPIRRTMATFEREIFQSIGTTMPYAFFRRIYDMRHTPIKPFDFEFFYRAMFIAIEAKQQKDRLDFRRIKSHQMLNLEKVEANGGYSFFFIRIENSKLHQNKFRAFIVPFPVMKDHMENSGKASINVKELASIACFEAQRYRHESGAYLWNFNEFFEDFTPGMLSGRDP